MRTKKHTAELLIALLLVSSAVFSVGIVFADNHPPGPGSTGQQNPPSGPGSMGQQQPPPGLGSTGQQTLPFIRLSNPLKVDSIEKLLNLILEIVVIFATPIIVFMIMYAGFKFVTAQGNTTELAKARDALLYAVIGGVIILGAKALLIVLTGTIKML